MNTRIKGNIGVGRAIAYYTGLGYAVSIPLTDTQPYDLIVDNGKLLFRVQVKYTESHYVGLRTIRCNSKKVKTSKLDATKIDILFIASKDNGFYEIPISELKVRTAISLGDKYKKWIVT